jgi:hypothetical protein
VIQLRNKGISPVTINTYLRHIKTFYLWKKKDWTLPWLKEEQKILTTFSAEAVRSFISWKPAKRGERRLKTLALAALDTGMRIEKLLA